MSTAVYNTSIRIRDKTQSFKKIVIVINTIIKKGNILPFSSTFWWNSQMIIYYPCTSERWTRYNSQMSLFFSISSIFPSVVRKKNLEHSFNDNLDIKFLKYTIYINENTLFNILNILKRELL